MQDMLGIASPYDGMKMRGALRAICRARPSGHEPAGKGPEARMASGTLMVACRRCRPQPDLSDEVCLACVVRLMDLHKGIGRVMLCGDIDACYEGASLRALAEMAELRRVCERSKERRTGAKSCNACPASPNAVFGALALSPGPEGIAVQLERVQRTAPNGQQCRPCIAETVACLESMGSRAKAMEREIARRAFKVVEVAAHA